MSYPYAEHDNGVVLTQPRPGEFERRPMTAGELAAREPALKIAKDIYRHANQAGVCYYEFWRLIADAIDACARPEAPLKPASLEQAKDVATKATLAAQIMLQNPVVLANEKARHILVDTRDAANAFLAAHPDETIPSPQLRLCGCPGACQGYATLSKGVVCSMHVPESIARP